MTLGDIITSVIAALALLVSLATAYLTLWSGFRVTVLPRRRPVLYQVDGIPCLMLECEFVNDGARPGSVEDMLVYLRRPDSGEKYEFTPSLVRDQFNIFHSYQKDDFAPFAGISIGARQRRELCIVFSPTQKPFVPPVGNVVVDTRLAVDSKLKGWIVSPTTLSLNLGEDLAARWASPDGSPLQVTAVEITQRRNDYRRGGWFRRWLERRGIL